MLHRWFIAVLLVINRNFETLAIMIISFSAGIMFALIFDHVMSLRITIGKKDE